MNGESHKRWSLEPPNRVPGFANVVAVSGCVQDVEGGSNCSTNSNEHQSLLRRWCICEMHDITGIHRQHVGKEFTQITSVKLRHIDKWIKLTHTGLFGIMSLITLMFSFRVYKVSGPGKCWLDCQLFAGSWKLVEIPPGGRWWGADAQWLTINYYQPRNSVHH